MTRIAQLWWQVERWPRWVRWVAHIWAWLGILPFSTRSLFGWAPIAHGDRSGFDSILILLCCLVTLISIPAWRGGKQRTTRTGRDLQRFFGVVFLPAIAVFSGYLTAIVTLPSIAVLASGQDIEIVLTVDHVVPRRQRGCTKPVYLQDLPSSLFDRVCLEETYSPQPVRSDWLEPGRQIVVSGRGNRRVIFPRIVRPLDDRPFGKIASTIAWAPPVVPEKSRP